MSVNKPYRRTHRPFIDGKFGNSYLMHRKYAKEPHHYLKAFLLLQNDLLDLFNYVEPADQNLKTYSHKIQQLLMRTCVEIEANFTAILIENGYKGRKSKSRRPISWNIEDYRLVNHSHRLSSYEARIPGWNGIQGLCKPYEPWKNDEQLPWYKAYNESKHDRQNNFPQAKLKYLIDAMCGLVILITAQFSNESYQPGPIGIAIEYEGYDSDDGMISAIGGVFRVKKPADWPVEERYDFKWRDLREMEDPFDEFNHAQYYNKG